MLWVFGTYVGLPVDEVKALFHIRLDQEDDAYVYLMLLPRTAKTRQQYVSRIRVALDRKTFRMRQVWKEGPNGSTVTWDFDTPVKVKQPITEETLLQDFPKEMERIP